MMVKADKHKSVMEHALHLVGDPADGTDREDVQGKWHPEYI